MPESSQEAALVPSRIPVSASTAPATSERALVRAARRGDPAAAEALARRHWDSAYHAAYLILRDAGAAEDVAQDSVLKALSSLGRFDRRRSLAPWVHRIVVNRAIDMARARGRRAEVELEDASLGDASTDPSIGHGPIGAALAELDADSRAIVVLRFLFDYRATEIARMLGTTPGAVRTRLHRATKTLRERLSEEKR